MRLAVAVIVCLSSAALAGGRGGHNTTFDPNLYGGAANVSCITASMPGTCSTGYGATCDGVTDDSSAFTSWNTASVAANPTPAVLLIPSGKSCRLAADQQITSGITNAVIWGYGATITRPYIGAAGATGGARFINAASIGDTSVVLQTAADASDFSVGKWAMVNGLENQYPDCGFPINPSFFDYVLVTAVTGTTTKTISFSPPLTNNYLTTWPLVCDDGPANIKANPSTWDTNVKIYGLTIKDTGQAVVIGRTIQIQDVVFPDNGVDPTFSDSIFISGSQLRSTEMDKIIDLFTCYRCAANFINFQSASIKNAVFDSLSMPGRGGNLADVQGTPKNISIVNSKIPTLWVGPNGNGTTRSISLDGSTINSSLGGIEFITASLLSFSSGTFSILKSDPNAGTFIHIGVVGSKYTFGESGVDFLSSPSVPSSTFTITAIREDTTKFYWDTDIVGAEPTPTCSGSPCSKILPWPSATVTQKFTGPANLAPFAAP